MKNYLIETTTNGYFVHAGDTPYGGPYKNEESAKRRIRDLKRKDNEAAKPELPDGDIKPVEQSPTPVVASMDNYVPPIIPNKPYILQSVAEKLEPLMAKYGTPNVEKLAASSEYGKSNFKAAELETSTVIHPSLTNGRTRQVGCYPAISKHAYQR